MGATSQCTSREADGQLEIPVLGDARSVIRKHAVCSIAIDFRSSFTTSGIKTYQQPLHAVCLQNPYIAIIDAFGELLAEAIPVFKIGEMGRHFSLLDPQHELTYADCDEVIHRYKQINSVVESGINSYLTPLLQKEIEYEKITLHENYALIFVISDGYIADLRQVDSILADKGLKIAVILVLVGDESPEFSQEYNNIKTIPFSDARQKFLRAISEAVIAIIT